MLANDNGTASRQNTNEPVGASMNSLRIGRRGLQQLESPRILFGHMYVERVREVVRKRNGASAIRLLDFVAPAASVTATKAVLVTLAEPQKLTLQSSMAWRRASPSIAIRVRIRGARYRNDNTSTIPERQRRAHQS